MLVHKREGEEVKNEFVTEQSQVLGGRITMFRKKGGVINHMTLTRASSIPQPHPNRVQAEVLVGAGNTQYP